MLWISYAGLILCAAAYVINVRWRFACIGRSLAVGVAAGALVAVQEADGPALWFDAEREWFRVLPNFAVSGPAGFQVVMPIWILMAILSIMAFVAHRGIRRIPPGRCRECGYDLTGNTSGRCPECGQAIAAPLP